MTNTAETYWDVDGISLQTYAFNIETIGGERQAPPPVRGEDLVVPYLPGSIFVPKVPDKRVITLMMWVIGANEDGTIPQNADMRRTFDHNWRMLRSLLFRHRAQFTLTKRFWVPTADLMAAGAAAYVLQTSGDWSLIKASAKASFASGLTPEMDGPARATFTVDLLLSDPYFYSDPLTIPFSVNTGVGLPGPTQSISVLGDDRTFDITANYVGPLTSPQFTLSSDTVLPWMRYATVVADGDTATVSVKQFSAHHTQALVTTRTSGHVRHYGNKLWFYLDPGDAQVALTVQEGTGSAELVYRPAWI